MLRVFQFSNGDRGRNGDCKTKGTYPRKCENFSAKALREIATMKTAWPSMFQRWTVGETCRRLCPTAILREIYLSSASLNAFSSFSSISFSLFFFCFSLLFIFFSTRNTLQFVVGDLYFRFDRYRLWNVQLALVVKDFVFPRISFLRIKDTWNIVKKKERKKETKEFKKKKKRKENRNVDNGRVFYVENKKQIVFFGRRNLSK